MLATYSNSRLLEVSRRSRPHNQDAHQEEHQDSSSACPPACPSARLPLSLQLSSLRRLRATSLRISLAATFSSIRQIRSRVSVKRNTREHKAPKHPSRARTTGKTETLPGAAPTQFNIPCFHSPLLVRGVIASTVSSTRAEYYCRTVYMASSAREPLVYHAICPVLHVHAAPAVLAVGAKGHRSVDDYLGLD
ncbi:hypothetical protein CHU98_g2864 [Xylaria longipes]|nr:hypothetical protein CHU98_g2864 [Xylaria longipes]